MKKNILIAIIFLFAGLNLSAQTEADNVSGEIEKLFINPEEEPTFPGGMDSLMNFIAKNLEYPELARINKIEGRVFLTFMIEEDGSISNIRILRDIGYGCGTAAVNLVKKMPKWIPAKQRGKPVRVQYNLPVTFSLKDFKKQEDNETPLDEEPSFPGGLPALMNYLAKNIKYPNAAKNSGIQGRVFVSFIIEKDGTVSNIKILRDIGYGCGEAAIKVLEKMPKWIPAKQKGVPVKANYNLPVTFALGDE